MNSAFLTEKKVISLTDEVWNVQKILEYSDIIDIDLSFQSNCRWDKSKKDKFLTSLLTNEHVDKIILCDVKSCLSSSETQEDRDYYNRWLNPTDPNKNPVKYLIIDGNNRITTLRDMKAGRDITFDTYAYITEENIRIDVLGGDYASLSTDAKNWLLNKNIIITVIKKASQLDLTNVFRKKNSAGEPLNRPELRNAYLGYLSDTIRQMTVTYADLAKIWFSDSKKNSDFIRRNVDNFFAELYAFYEKGEDARVNHNQLDNIYIAQKSINVADEFVRFFKQFYKGIIEPNEIHIKKSSKIQFLNLYMLYRKLVAENKQIKNSTEFVELWMQAENVLRVSDTLYNISDGEYVTYNQLLSANTDHKAKTIKRMSALRQEMKLDQYIKDQGLPQKIKAKPSINVEIPSKVLSVSACIPSGEDKTNTLYSLK